MSLNLSLSSMAASSRTPRTFRERGFPKRFESQSFLGVPAGFPLVAPVHSHTQNPLGSVEPVRIACAPYTVVDLSLRWLWQCPPYVCCELTKQLSCLSVEQIFGKGYGMPSTAIGAMGDAQVNRRVGGRELTCRGGHSRRRASTECPGCGAWP